MKSLAQLPNALQFWNVSASDINPCWHRLVIEQKQYIQHLRHTHWRTHAFITKLSPKNDFIHKTIRPHLFGQTCPELLLWVQYTGSISFHYDPLWRGCDHLPKCYFNKCLALKTARVTKRLHRWPSLSLERNTQRLTLWSQTDAQLHTADQNVELLLTVRETALEPHTVNPSNLKAKPIQMYLTNLRWLSATFTRSVLLDQKRAALCASPCAPSPNTQKTCNCTFGA